MRIAYRLAWKDYYEAWRELNAKRRRVSTCAVLIYSGWLWVVGMRTRDARSSHIFFVLGLACAVLPSAAGWLKRRFFKRACRGAGENEIVVEISDDGIRGRDGAAVAWLRFSNYSESQNDFVLYHAGMIDEIFPKRAFSDSDVESFRRILKQNLRSL
jgi:hypothetical protein